MICWFCYWGWHPQVKAIFDEAVAQIGDESPLMGGPSHIVWADENFDSAQWCLDHFDEYKGDYSEIDLAIVRKSLECLVALPAEFKTEPAGYDGEHPEHYPPVWLPQEEARG